MLKPAVVDLSHHNVVPSSLTPAVENGIVGVIHKCTEGTSYVDDKVDARWFLAREAGAKWGLYHFVRPGSMSAQVEHFVNSAEECSDDDTLFALDWEDTGVSLDQAVEFMQRLEEEIERSPVLYSGHVLKEALGGKADKRLSCYRLWLAQYASAPTLPPGWDDYFLWQYTDAGAVNGITPPTDLNAYLGSAEELRADWSGAAKVPAPEPQPEAMVTVTIVSPPGVEVQVNIIKG